MLPGVLSSCNFAFNAPLAKTAWDQNAITVGQVLVGGFISKLFREHPFDLNFRFVFIACMPQGFSY